MTPAMHLSAIKVSFSHCANKDEIYLALDQAFSLGHEFGIERAAGVVDKCNREGPYNAIGAASRIRGLAVEKAAPQRLGQDQDTTLGGTVT